MAHRKRVPCPKCCPPEIGNAIFTAETDYSQTPERLFWECTNCGYEMPRRVNRRKEGFTPSQKRVVDFIIARGFKLRETRRFIHGVWVTLERTNDYGYTQMVYGLIGARGKLDLTQTHAFLSDDKITTYQDLRWMIHEKY